MEKPKNLEEIYHNHVNSLLDSLKEDESVDIENSEICKFYEGLNVLITGGSGFLGTLLIEKLLRSCPKINKLYMLVRAKKGKTPEQRFKEHFNNAVYNRLRLEQPDFISHVELIEGDTSLSDLGLSLRDREKLIENVHIVFHGAATVRFDESLRQAVDINVGGTKSVLLLTREIKNIKAFVHVSTAFSHCIVNHIDEKFYDPPMEPDKVLTLVRMLDDKLLKHMTPHIIDKYPNTYAFTKALGEEVVRQMSVDIPTCVVRPSIMLATYKEPVPGWINNFYGATGVMTGAGMGLLHSLHCSPTNIAEIIPADFVINNIIVAAWDVAVKEKKKNGFNKDSREDPLVYNAVSSCQNPITWGEFSNYNHGHGKEIPTNTQVWHYLFKLNKHLWLHNLYVLFLHLIPGAIIDFLVILSGRKPILLKTYKKIHKFSGVISYFSSQQWKFSNNNLLALWDRTKPTDRKIFDFNLKNLDWNHCFYNQVRGVRVFIVNDPLDTVEKAKVKVNRLRIVHYTYVTVMFVLLTWLLLSFIRLMAYLLEFYFY